MQNILKSRVPNQELLYHQVEDICQTRYVCEFSLLKDGEQVDAIVTNDLA